MGFNDLSVMFILESTTVCMMCRILGKTETLHIPVLSWRRSTFYGYISIQGKSCFIFSACNKLITYFNVIMHTIIFSAHCPIFINLDMNFWEKRGAMGRNTVQTDKICENISIKFLFNLYLDRPFATKNLFLYIT